MRYWNPLEEMRAFDQLPKRVRDALNNSPVKHVGLQRWAALYGKVPAVKVSVPGN
jgi:hypothetical protein